MVGFNTTIVFNNNGKIIDYQKAYNQNYGKTVNIFLPLNFNNKKNYKAEMSVAINNTFPKEIEIVEGVKSDSDLNKYTFDVTQLYYLNVKKKLGLSKIKLYSSNGRTQFESESFRL